VGKYAFEIVAKIQRIYYCKSTLSANPRRKSVCLAFLKVKMARYSVVRGNYGYGFACYHVPFRRRFCSVDAHPTHASCSAEVEVKVSNLIALFEPLVFKNKKIKRPFDFRPIWPARHAMSLARLAQTRENVG
jgi:hypothetical protein